MTGKGYFVKCPVCENKFDRSVVNSVKINNRYYHEKCAEEKQKLQNDKEELIKFIQKCIGQEVNKKITNQVEKFGRDGYKFKGIQLTIEYYLLLGYELNAQEGLSFVPYYYNDAKHHYIMKQKANKAAEEVDEPVKQRSIRIKDPELRERHRKKGDIDIEEL